MATSNDMEVSFAQYAQTWIEAEPLRERLEHYSAGRFRLLVRERLVVLEVGERAVSCCTTGDDASKDVVLCFGRWAAKDVDC